MADIILANKELNEWCGTEGINYYEGIEALGFLFKYAEFKAVIAIGVKQKISIDDARRQLFEQWLDNIKRGLNYTNALFWALNQLKEKSLQFSLLVKHSKGVE